MSSEIDQDRIVATAEEVLAALPENPQEALVALVGSVDAYRLASEHSDDWGYALRLAAYSEARRRLAEGGTEEKNTLTEPENGATILA